MHVNQAWNENIRGGAPKKQSDFIMRLKKKHKRAKLPNTVTIDSVYEKKFLSLSSVIEAVIIDAFILPGIIHAFLLLVNINLRGTIVGFCYPVRIKQYNILYDLAPSLSVVWMS